MSVQEKANIFAFIFLLETLENKDELLKFSVLVQLTG